MGVGSNSENEEDVHTYKLVDLNHRGFLPDYEDYDLDCDDPEYRFSDPVCRERLERQEEEEQMIKGPEMMPVEGSKIGHDLIYMFGPWSAWTECSASCGRGKKTRARTCDHPDICDKGQEVDVTICVKQRIRRRSWSEWSTCSTSCGDGEQLRERSCHSNNICGCRPLIQRRKSKCPKCDVACVPNPGTWVDNTGDGCQIYQQQAWCTFSGRKG